MSSRNLTEVEIMIPNIMIKYTFEWSYSNIFYTSVINENGHE